MPEEPNTRFLRSLSEIAAQDLANILARENLEAVRRFITESPREWYTPPRSRSRTSQIITGYEPIEWLTYPAPAEVASPPHGFRYCEECGDTIEVSAVTHPGCDPF
jgi:hypothetical protein